jgi:hypothetical protein
MLFLSEGLLSSQCKEEESEIGVHNERSIKKAGKDKRAETNFIYVGTERPNYLTNLPRV